MRRRWVLSVICLAAVVALAGCSKMTKAEQRAEKCADLWDTYDIFDRNDDNFGRRMAKQDLQRAKCYHRE